MSISFGEKLKEARNIKGLKQSELAMRLGVKNTTISNWENNISKPDLDTLAYICGILGVKVSYFLDAKLPEDEITIQEFELIKKYRNLDDYGRETIDIALERESARVQRLTDLQSRPAALVEFQKTSGTPMSIYTYMHKLASAGNGFYFDDIPTETIEAPYMEGADFIIGVSGDSMEPTYHDGDLVYVQKRQIVEIGDIGIFMVNNECYIKEAGEEGLISHNKKYPMIPGDESIQCIGKVLGKVKGQ